MNKKAFTLMEMMVSITLFSIVMTFLYYSLNQSKNFNSSFSKHLENYISNTTIQKIITEDIIETKGKINLTTKDKNTILKITNTNNTYHNPFNKHITYILSKQNNLLRIESDKKFDFKTISNLIEDKNTYIDIVKNNVLEFIVLANKTQLNSYTILIKYKNGKESFFSVKKFIS